MVAEGDRKKYQTEDLWTKHYTSSEMSFLQRIHKEPGQCLHYKRSEWTTIQRLHMHKDKTLTTQIARRVPGLHLTYGRGLWI
jgi:hypothetical protein